MPNLSYISPTFPNRERVGSNLRFQYPFNFGGLNTKKICTDQQPKILTGFKLGFSISYEEIKPEIHLHSKNQKPDSRTDWNSRTRFCRVKNEKKRNSKKLVHGINIQNTMGKNKRRNIYVISPCGFELEKYLKN